MKQSKKRALEKLGESPKLDLRQALKKVREVPWKQSRKRGAGPPYALTEDEKARGQKIVRNALHDNPRLARKTYDELVEHFRPLFNLEREVSVRTLWRHIIGPVVGPRRQRHSVRTQ